MKHGFNTIRLLHTLFIFMAITCPQFLGWWGLSLLKVQNLFPSPPHIVLLKIIWGTLHLNLKNSNEFYVGPPISTF